MVRVGLAPVGAVLTGFLPRATSDLPVSGGNKCSQVLKQSLTKECHALEKQTKPSSFSEPALYYCVIWIIITTSTQDNHTSLVTFDINGGNTNKFPMCFKRLSKEAHSLVPYLATNAVWVNDGALCCRSLGERIHKHPLLILWVVQRREPAWEHVMAETMPVEPSRMFSHSQKRCLRYYRCFIDNTSLQFVCVWYAHMQTGETQKEGRRGK